MAQLHGDFLKGIQSESLIFEGADALRFLNGLCTAHITRQASSGQRICGRSLFLDVKGKLIAPFIYIVDSASKVRLRVDTGGHSSLQMVQQMTTSLMDQLNSLIIADDVCIRREPVDIYFCWNADLAKHVSSVPLPGIKPESKDQIYLLGDMWGYECLPRPHLGSNAFELWATPRAESLSGVDISESHLNEIFFENNFLEFPSQLKVGDLPLEFKLEDAISFFKGCYRGQEVIARATFRGKLVKSLCKVEFAYMLPVGENSITNQNGQVVGEIRSLSEDQRHALAILRFDAEDFFVSETKIKIVNILRLVPELNEAFR